MLNGELFCTEKDECFQVIVGRHIWCVDVHIQFITRDGHLGKAFPISLKVFCGVSIDSHRLSTIIVPGPFQNSFSCVQSLLLLALSFFGIHQAKTILYPLCYSSINQETRYFSNLSKFSRLSCLIRSSVVAMFLYFFGKYLKRV